MAGKRNYDFAGWVTKNDIQCSDGVIIKHDAFKDNDGEKVPLVWNHTYDSPTSVLGHILLQNRTEGVYGYGYFNETDEAGHAKVLVDRGDISSMSIGARKLKRNGASLVHGSIYEVSLVLAGANPGAKIDSIMQHSEDGAEEEEGIVYTGTLIHSATDIVTEDVEDVKHSDDNSKEKTIGDVLDTLNDEQKDAVHALLGMVADAGAPDDEVKHSGVEPENEDDKTPEGEEPEEDNKTPEGEEPEEDGKTPEGDEPEGDEEPNTNNEDNEGDGEIMKQNVFAGKGQNGNNVLKHSLNEVLKQAQAGKVSSLKDLIKEIEFKGADGEVLTHGINSIDMLFPEVGQSTNGNTPILYKDPNTAYSEILDAVNKSPFSKVKTTIADLTEDEARAKGYIKGNMKKEEFFSLIKRSTQPTTVYKKQKLDRDDIIDIIDFDVVAFMNVEMNMMIKEEIARAILVGDGRDFSSEDKIDEQHIRPIISDNEFFTIHKTFDGADKFIEAVIMGMMEYRGSGRPNCYIDPVLLGQVKLLKGTDGRFLFGDIPSTESIAARLGFNKIVETTFMTGKGALVVNLRDYTLGASKGGELTNFDDFDIDFNQHKYLIETRLSGALTLPKSAIHFMPGTTKGPAADNTKGGLTFGERQADKTPPIGG